MGAKGWAATLQVAAAQSPQDRYVYRCRFLPFRPEAETLHLSQGQCWKPEHWAKLHLLVQIVKPSACCRCCRNAGHSDQLQCSMMFNTSAPAAQCQRQVLCASRWQKLSAVHCNDTLYRATAKHNIGRPHQDSKTRAYNDILPKCLDEVSGERETGADYGTLCISRLFCEHWLHTRLFDELQRAIKLCSE